ncbi:zinc-finger of transposase IS204/IS1001/IS1096/IS1165 domain protein, partial [Staphylococcus aureus subsp. aureus CO-98]
STITLLKIMEMPAYLELQKQRFYCKSCESILLLNLILSTLIVLFLIKQNLQF